MAEEAKTPNPEALLRELEVKLDRLRALYDQFFMGIEKTPPLVLKKDVIRLLDMLQRMPVRRTATKFRIQTQVQRFSSMKTLWARTEREIEQGTHRRQVARAQRREREALSSGNTDAALTAADLAAIAAVRDAQGEEAAQEAEARRLEARTEAGAEAEAFMNQLMGDRASSAGTATNTEAATSTASRTRESEPAEPGLPVSKAERIRMLQQRFGGGDGTGAVAPAIERRPAKAAAPAAPSKAHTLYEKLVATRRQLNERTDGLSVEALERTLDRQRKAVREKHQCRDVDFDVVVKDGKAFIKPIPKF